MEKRNDNAALLSQHEKLIIGSAVSPDVAEARGYRSVTTKAELARLGFGERQRRVPALLLPVHTVRGEIGNYQIRPDEPRISNGKPVKYETPAKSRMLLDVPPLALEWIKDPERPLFITEGIRKADSAVSKGLCCIALLGVWNFRGSNEYGGKAALPDWEYVALNGRQVYICFDSDVMVKPEVNRAMARLKSLLEERGAHVSLIYLPPAQDGGKVGLDDYLAGGGTVGDLLALASSELRQSPGEDEENREIPYRVTPEGLIWLKKTGEGDVPVSLTNFGAKIVGDVYEDDGAETRRLLEIEAVLNGRTARFAVPARHFHGMTWPMEQLGAGAIVFPGFGLRDHARTAVQLLSPAIRERRIYSHTGWREIEGAWAYLHGGGAIGPGGRVEGVEVGLPDSMAGFSLPDPPSDDELWNAVRASVRLLELAPDVIVFPVFAGIWRAALGNADFSLHLCGPTGVGKSELAALAQQHWGQGLDARHLPGSWSSTGNALEGLAFTAKDALLVVDDFAPSGAPADMARLHRDADRLLRAQGNSSGRMRMRSDATLKPVKPPRGLILSTGEDVPRGQSLRSRVVILELSPGMLDFPQLTSRQRDAGSGLYARALSGFVSWLAPRIAELRGRLADDVAQLREMASESHLHRRTPDIVANLALGLREFLRFAVEIGVLNSDEAKALGERGWKALGEAAARQAQHQAASEPAQRFIELVGAAIASGRAHIAGNGGDAPDNPEAWGWREATVGAGDSARASWRPQGERIGWVEGDDLYLEPEASNVAAQRMAREGGETLTVGSKTLHKRLREKGLLASTDERRSTLAVRRVLEGSRRSVLHLRATSLVCTGPDQTDHSPAHEAGGGQIPGQFSGQFAALHPEETDHETCPEPCTTGAEVPSAVSLGSLPEVGDAGGSEEDALAGEVRRALEGRPVPVDVAPGQTVSDIDGYARQEAQSALSSSPAVSGPARERLAGLGVFVDDGSQGGEANENRRVAEAG